MLLHEEANLLARLSERQSHLVSGTLKQAALAGRVSAENERLLQDLEGSTDRIQEVHHRIRNHLQTVTGLLCVQQASETSPSARRALQQSVGRIASVATVHDLLARDPVQGVLRLPDLVRQLADHVLRSASAEARVKVEIDVSPLALSERQATAFVLVLAELISNAIEHAFPGGACGRILLRVTEHSGAASLDVRDDGPGLPPDLDLRKAGNLGLGLVTRLVERDLGGSISARNDGGAVFNITFPVHDVGGPQ
ncbi:MAG: sensor histidine kinase [Armatimonadota bacterium]